jgi:RNA polymerase sigma factor (sigma-70 family)
MDSTDDTLRPDELLAQLGWVRALARSLVADPDVTDDVLQQVCLLALQQAPREARGGPRLRAWLAAVTRSLARRSARSDARRLRREQAAAQPEALPDTADIAAHREALRHLVDAVTSLEEPYYSVIVARYFDGREVAEIAARRGASAAAVRQQLSRARQQLRARLQSLLADDRQAWLRAALPVAAFPDPSAVSSAAPLPCSLAGAGATPLAGHFGGLLVAKKLAVGLVLVVCLLLGTWYGLRAGDRAASPPMPGPSIASDVPHGGAARLPGPSAATASALDAAEPVSVPATPATASPDGETLRIAGRVIDAAGRPVAGALVRHWPTESYRERHGLGRSSVFLDGIPWDSLVSSRTGADGRFVLDTRDDSLRRQKLFASDGIYGSPFAETMEARPVLIIEESGHAITAAFITAEQAGDVDVGDIVVDEAAVVTGRLVDPAGAPVAGVRVEVDATGRLVEERKRPRELLAQRVSAVTDAAGRFRLAGLWPGEWSLFALPPGFVRVSRPFTIERSGELELGDVQLAAGGRLAGRVVDALGAPIPGARIRLRPCMSLGVAGPEAGPAAWGAIVRFSGRRFDLDAVADAEGSFAIGGLEAPGDFEQGYDVMANAEGCDAGVVRCVSPGRDDLVLRLPPQAVWELRFVDAASRERVTDAEVGGRRLSDEEGSWSVRLQGEQEGDLVLLRGASSLRTQVVVSAPGYAKQSFALPGLPAGARKQEVLSLAREAILAGRIMDDAGMPLEGAAVKLRPAEDMREALGERDAVTDVEGRYHLAGIAGGDWTLQVAATDCLPMLEPLALSVATAEVRDGVDIVLPRGATITGVLVDAAEPLPGVSVTATSKSSEAIAASMQVGHDDGMRHGAPGGSPTPSPPSGRPPRSIWAHAFTGNDGRFAITGLPSGHWEVDGREGATASVDLRAGQTVDVTLVRPRPPTVMGRVTSRGQAVAGALVELGFGPDVGSPWITLASARADIAGNYEIRHLDAGTFYLRASNGQSPSGPVEAELGWNHAQLVDLALPTGHVRGRVTSQGGDAPLADIEVRLSDPAVELRSGYDPLRLETRTDADGRFRFDGIEPGTWKLQAGSGLFCPVEIGEVKVVEGEETPDLSIPLQLGGTVEVSLGGAATQGLLLVTLSPPGPADDSKRNAHVGDTLRFTAVPPVDYELTVHRRDGKALTLIHGERVRVVAGEVLRVQIALDG